MSDHELNLGLQTLEKEEEQVVITIRNNLEPISRYLRDKKIIDRNLYWEVTDPDAVQADHKRAKKVFNELTKKVKGLDARYNVFLDGLRKCQTCDHTIYKLERAYEELKKESIVAESDIKLKRPKQAIEELRSISDSTQVEPPHNIQRLTSKDIPIFSKLLSVQEFAEWMSQYHGLSEDDCDKLKKNKISGKAFSMLTEANIDDLVPELGSRITLKSVLNEIKVNSQTDKASGNNEESASFRDFFNEKVLEDQCQSIELQSDYKAVTEMNEQQRKKFTVKQMGLLDDKIKHVKGRGTNIAIIDMIGTSTAGFHTQHWAFKGKIFSKDVKCFKASYFEDTTNHATVCAGIAVGKPFKGYVIKDGKTVTIDYKGGVAHGAKAKIFLVEKKYGFLEALKTIQALNKIEDEKIDVVSISLGSETGEATSVTQAIKDLSKSMLIVVSAGNSGTVEDVLYPANLAEVISVGSYTEFGREAPYSPEGVDICCYGDVNAPASDGNNGLMQWATGTSMAAPAIAGIICLFIQCAKEGKYNLPEDSKEDVIRRMKQKKNMMCILHETLNPFKQVKPARLLEEAFTTTNFKQWFDVILKAAEAKMKYPGSHAAMHLQQRSLSSGSQELKGSSACATKKSPPRDIEHSSSEDILKFSRRFTPEQLADWMSLNHALSDDACDKLKRHNISSKVFLVMTEADINNLVEDFGSRTTLKLVLDEIKGKLQLDESTTINDELASSVGTRLLKMDSKKKLESSLSQTKKDCSPLDRKFTLEKLQHLKYTLASGSKQVLQVIYQVAHEWKLIGTIFGLSIGTLRYANDREGMSEVFIKLIKRDLTWRALVENLSLIENCKSVTVQLKDIAIQDPDVL